MRALLSFANGLRLHTSKIAPPPAVVNPTQASVFLGGFSGAPARLNGGGRSAGGIYSKNGSPALR